MASIANDTGGRKRIFFYTAAGNHKSIRLGIVPDREAEKLRIGIEEILEAHAQQLPLSEETQSWVDALPDALAKKLAKAGLIAPRVAAIGGPAGDPGAPPVALTLGKHLDDYFAERRSHAKPSTVIVWSQARRNLLAFFGPERELAGITRGDAKDFERWLRAPGTRKNRWGENAADSGLSVNTARKRIGNAKQFFEDAVERELLKSNPFAGLKGTVGANRKRDYFVTRDQAASVLEACPDAEWRLLFALSRFAGLRCPSETLLLRWGDVDWENGRLTVRSPKTEHHEGKDSRIVPIFPELRPHLEVVFDAAEPGTEHVIHSYRDAQKNFRTRLQRIIGRAGLKPWPNLFHSLRKTRQTELEDLFPTHVVCAWMGNNERTAAKHYLQVTEAHFERAHSIDTEQQNGAKAVRNGAKGSASERQASGEPQETAVNAGWRSDALETMAEAGLEPARP